MRRASKRLSWRKYKYINLVVSRHTNEMKTITEENNSDNITLTDPCTSTSHATLDYLNNSTSAATVPINTFPNDSDEESSHYDSDPERFLFDSDEDEYLASSDDESSNMDRLDFKHKLASWAADEEIPREKFNKLLAILREHPCHSDLPKDSRTLLHTPRKLQLLSLGGGTYYHFGVEKGIQSQLESVEEIPATVELLLNVDGLPISKSSTSQLWPILGSLSYTISNSSVFMVGLFHGNKKPSDSAQYLSHCITELNNILRNGIKIKNTIVKVKIKGIICDAPARAFVLNIKTHSGYHSCSKCMQEGQYINNRVCFPDFCSNLRTDEDFKEMKDEDHHIGISPLLDLQGFGCVTQMPYEYMHLVCLGVMRKLVNLWVKSRKTKQASNKSLLSYGRLTPHQIVDVSNYLQKLKIHISVEFNRKPRSLLEIDRWKATELRQLLLYTGPVVFKEVLERDAYHHFLVLHCAMRILTDSIKFHNLINYAHELLVCFVKGFSTLYGKEFVSYNVHGLLHMCEDVRNFGPLDNYSAFQFENYMQCIKKLLRKAEKPVSQVARRILEKRYVSKTKSSNVSFKLCKEHFDGPVLPQFNLCHQYKNMHYNNFIFSNCRPDNICILVEGDVVEIENIVKKDNEIIIFGRKFLKGVDFFKQPCPSSRLGISIIHEKKGDLSFWPINVILSKCLLLPYKTGFVVMPLCATK